VELISFVLPQTATQIQITEKESEDRGGKKKKKLKGSLYPSFDVFEGGFSKATTHHTKTPENKPERKMEEISAY